MLCSICINTYKRPVLLKKLLDSLVTQILDPIISLEIIVVDNDPDKQAGNVVRAFKTISSIDIKYFEQPIKNISLTRNKAVSEANGEFILFIDDDEYAQPNWIINTLACLEKYNADAVFGSVLSYFDVNTPNWIKSNLMFRRQIQKTGTIPAFTRTGNCLIKAAILNTVDGPFDLEYGLTGGGDSFLFNLLSRNGAKFIYCAESIVYEYVPPERASLNWLLKRSLRTGSGATRHLIKFAKNKFATRIWLFLKAILFSLICLFLMIVNLPSKKRFINWTIIFAGNLGHIMAIFNFHYVEYK